MGEGGGVGGGGMGGDGLPRANVGRPTEVIMSG